MRYAGMSSKWLFCVVLLMILALLSGCSPQYDWRMVTLGDGRVRAMLPDKPQAVEREFNFEGHEITFVLTSASVEGVLFTVGYADLPEGLRSDASARERLVRQTQASLYQNLGVVPPASLPAAGERFTVTAPDPGPGQRHTEALRLEAMIWATSHALIEGIVIGKAGTLPQNQIKEFLRELAPDQRLDLAKEAQVEAF